MDKDTKHCISISEKPGKFGVYFHNKGYDILGLNYVYFPLKVKANQLKGILGLIKDNFQGCSVSKPHKIKVIDYLDELDPSAEKIGAVNTILNKNEKLIGYNTDYNGARRAILNNYNISEKKVLMLGAGGAARAIGYAVKDIGGKLIISNRDPEKAKGLAKKLDAEFLKWESRNDFCKGSLLINATSVGFDNPENIPLAEKSLEEYNAVMDVVVGDTNLIQKAKEMGKITIPGIEITVYQAAKQFEIYTGKKLPQGFINRILLENEK